ncbi:MAG: site-specific DNA-methyltransferase, partial [Oscillospiraceae bacterium]|nr:site-specific DNA-methyltransferase [Oscillospiraceae bacterium]
MILCGDAAAQLQTIAAQTIDTCVTSPPYYGLRSYNTDGQIGLEQTYQEYIARLVDVFRAVRRVLRDDGTLWIVIGDSYANDGKWGGSTGGKHVKALHGSTGIGRRRTYTGLPSKNLIGIPWRLAIAL